MLLATHEVTFIINQKDSSYLGLPWVCHHTDHRCTAFHQHIHRSRHIRGVYDALRNSGSYDSICSWDIFSLRCIQPRGVLKQSCMQRKSDYLDLVFSCRRLIRRFYLIKPIIKIDCLT